MTLGLAVPAGILMPAFVVFAFRQGMQVPSKPEGIPPEQTGNYTVPRNE